MRVVPWILVALLFCVQEGHAQNATSPLAELHQAITKGDARAVERLLDQDPSLLSRQSPQGLVPLMLARRSEMARLLLERGADMYVVVPYEQTTPLEFMKREYRMEVGQMLDRYDAITIAMNGDCERAKKLLEGREFLAKAKHPNTGATLLHAAALWGDKELAETLLRLGADPNARDDAGSEPISMTAVWSEQDLYRLLVDLEGVPATLSSAAVNVDGNAFEKIVPENPRDINDPDHFGLHPKHYAARAGRTAALRVLLDRGAEIDSATPEGWTALHFAARFGHVDAIKFLLNRGASPSARTNEGQTPLMFACTTGKRDAIKPLLDADKSLINATDNRGNSAMLYASLMPDIAVYRLLLDTGADPDGGESGSSTPLIEACRWGNLALVELLLKSGAEPDRTDMEGSTALHAAALGAYAHIAEVLLRTDVPIDLQNHREMTALHYAVENNDAVITHMLLMRGASDDIEDSRGRTSREIAFREEMRHVTIVFAYLDSLEE